MSLPEVRLILARHERQEALRLHLQTEGQFLSAAAPWSKAAGRALERLRRVFDRWLR